MREPNNATMMEVSVMNTRFAKFLAGFSFILMSLTAGSMPAMAADGDQSAYPVEDSSTDAGC